MTDNPTQNVAPACSVIILNLNGRTFLRPCLRSVLAQTFTDFETLVVDNGSNDGSADDVEEEYPSVRVIRAMTNLGFAEGNNLGVRNARGEIIVLLNNDTIVEPHWLSELVKAVEGDGVALASSLVRTNGIPDQYYERNGSVNFLGHNIMRIFEEPKHLFYANGASLAFRRSIVGEPFDQDYFAYSEDLYLGFRARFMGYQVVHCPSSHVRHYGGMTSRSIPSNSIGMLQERNRLLTIALFFSGFTLVRIAPFLLLNVAGKLCAASLRKRYSLSGLLAAYWWLLTHAGAIRVKRSSLRRGRRVNEDDVIAWMTAHLTNGESRFGRILNRFASFYCLAVGLRTIEWSGEASR